MYSSTAKRASNFAYRARQYDATGTISAPEIASLLDGRRCAYCHRPATTLDHVQPLGPTGNNDAGNLLPSCAPCNRKKSNRTPQQAGMQVRGGQQMLPIFDLLRVDYE